jgi:molybdopterin-guanine dinucleotide biosynthesis protein A
MLTLERNITGVILVGGQSRRMGVDKAFLEVEGVPLLGRVLEVFKEIFAVTILVGGSSDRLAGFGLPCHPDIYPGSALGGLYTGLMAAETPFIFVAPCDLPFPSGDVIRHLVSVRNGYDAVVPVGATGYEPLLAVYGKNCREPMRGLLEQGNCRIYDIYGDLNINFVNSEILNRLEGGEKTFINLNTRDEYERLCPRKQP